MVFVAPGLLSLCPFVLLPFALSEAKGKKILVSVQNRWDMTDLPSGQA
jgi:hypothetical protein